VPELPEVETTRRGIAPYLVGHRIVATQVYNAKLRWPVTPRINAIENQWVNEITRRGKYLIFDLKNNGAMVVHLGMSGSLRIVQRDAPRKTHDHLEFLLDSGQRLLYHDPRRFGCVLWTDDWREHELIRHLGPEPLSADFDAGYLYEQAAGRKLPIKSLIMSASVVVGVGNIYANEALYQSGIHPLRAAGRISFARMEDLVRQIKNVLDAAITQGGTTLRDFVGGDGKPGYFKQQLFVYGRGGEPCKHCGHALKERRLTNRSTVYCPKCQR